jgi:hypothetical protein
MRRTPLVRVHHVLAGLGLALLAGCGKGGGGTGQDELTFQRLGDTTGLGAGAPIVQSFEAYRMDSGALRLKGRARLPDSTRLRVAIRHPGGAATLALVQVVLQDGAFDSPPIIGGRSPLPQDRYVFEISAQFTPDWQPAAVLRATDAGRSLRGPGMTRTQIGGAMLYLVEELTR